jgi:hypothetical protein
MTDTITIQELKTSNNLSSIQDGDQLLGERVDGTGGVITFNGVVYDADFSTNGLMARTASATYANRTITGTTNYIDVSNGDGVSGNPTLTISATYAGGTSIASLGTVTVGTWNASVVGMTYGGSGKALTASDGGIVYTDADSMEVLSGTATANKILLSGSSTAPVWSTPTFPNASATAGKVIVSDGTNWIASTSIYPNTVGTSGTLIRSDGTSNAYTTSTFADTYAASVLLYSNGANTVTGLATANSGVLVTSGAGVPSISTDIPTAVTIGSAYVYRASGTDVPITDGGTGVSTMTTAYAPVCAGTTATGALQVASTGLSTAGYVLTSNGASAVPSFQAASVAGVVTWSAAAGTTQAAAVNNGYVTTNAAQCNITLPGTCAVGDSVAVTGQGAGGWKFTANSGQTINVGSVASSTAGSMASANRYDGARVLCVVANTTWNLIEGVSAGYTIV